MEVKKKENSSSSHRLISPKLRGLKFMQRAEAKRKSTGDDSKNTENDSKKREEERNDTENDDNDDVKKSTTTTTKAIITTKPNDEKNEEHWTYETEEQVRERRTQLLAKEASFRSHISSLSVFDNPNWVEGRRSFGGFNKELEQIAREQQEKQEKAKAAIRVAREQKGDANVKKKRRRVSAK